MVCVNDNIKKEFYNYRFPETKDPKGPLGTKLILQYPWPQKWLGNFTYSGL